MKGEINYARAFRRGWWLIPLIATATVVVAGVVTTYQAEVYESSAMLVVGPSTLTADTEDVIRSIETLERRTVLATFADFARTDETRRLVATAIARPEEELRRYRIRGSVVPNTNIVRIDVSGPNGKTAAAVADAAAAETARQAGLLYRVFTLQMLERATVPRTPSYPEPRRNYLVGLVVGIFAGIGAVLLLERLRSSREPM